jgi:pimeloyl-ACP methyl ester carboxylesterase
MVESVENFQAIDLKTLILWGKKIFFKYVIARRLHKDIKNSTLTTVPYAGHFLQEDKPKAVLEHLSNFL